MEQPEKKKSHDFNIYYLNFSKVYEIAMMINNVILTKIETDKSSSFEEQYGYTSSISAQGTKQFLDGIKASISADARETSTSSSKVVESLDVKTTKSILLRRVIEQCASVTVLDSSAEGDLVKVDRVKLELLNEESLRQFLILRRDALKGMRVEGMEVNNLISSMLQDYAYILKGLVYDETNDIPIATFSRANGELRKEFEKFNNSSKLALLDLTSVSYAIEDNKALIYALEQFLSIMPNIRVIAQTAQIDVLLKYFPLFLDGQEPVCKLLPDLSGLGEKEPEESELAKVTDLSGESFETFIDAFDHNLIGHRYFKDRLRYSLKNFISLNKAKEQKVLSIFLFGASGIGKTEVARLIANGLQNDCYLAKINFQNYSSQDALNSLIGSPAGYVGCNHGELSEKIQKSKVGVLLCDEFEKTTRPVFSFFLELLEEGRFTDSMAREYDMDGYVIIFTSNLLSEAEYKKVIPPELQTRFDLVCEFEEPTTAEKTAFLDLLLEMAKTKYSEQFAKIEITEDDKKRLYAFDYSSLSALRDIKRVFNNRLMDYFVEKDVL